MYKYMEDVPHDVTNASLPDSMSSQYTRCVPTLGVGTEMWDVANFPYTYMGKVVSRKSVGMGMPTFFDLLYLYMYIDLICVQSRNQNSVSAGAQRWDIAAT